MLELMNVEFYFFLPLHHSAHAHIIRPEAVEDVKEEKEKVFRVAFCIKNHFFPICFRLIMTRVHFVVEFYFKAMRKLMKIV